MCGIAAILWAAEDTPPSDAKAAVLELAGRCGIARRGPDSLDACVPAPRVALAASVLTMRSSGDATQPATDERGNALCWNGEWFQGGPAPDAADAPAVLALLAEATADAPDAATAAWVTSLDQTEEWIFNLFEAGARGDAALDANFPGSDRIEAAKAKLARVVKLLENWLENQRLTPVYVDE